jgi:hypothetical protein
LADWQNVRAANNYRVNQTLQIAEFLSSKFRGKHHGSLTFALFGPNDPPTSGSFVPCQPKPLQIFNNATDPEIPADIDTLIRDLLVRRTYLCAPCCRARSSFLARRHKVIAVTRHEDIRS